ncbi:ABC transporter ATP-binding protein [Prevotella sp. AGR2160]|uniref:metal ABC transporter ATP-binding protein n=1 Tax=Prevotella sp. AGR2160 TaxID=1280674 RepID=UPI00041BC8D1
MTENHNSKDNQAIIMLHDVTAAYGRKVIFRHASLTIYDHDYLGIIGPNGGGKTTLLRILLGLMKPLEGTVTYLCDGKPVKEITMGYLPQYSAIDRQFPISVEEVVKAGLSSRKPLFRSFTAAQREQVEQTLREMELSDLADQPISALSGGQLQRVLLARAVVSNPQVIVLDEPNTYIDRHFQEQMYDMLDDLNRHCAIVIVSHDVTAIEPRARHLVEVDHALSFPS